MIHIREGLVVKILNDDKDIIEMLVNVNQKAIKPLPIQRLQEDFQQVTGLF